MRASIALACAAAAISTAGAQPATAATAAATHRAAPRARDWTQVVSPSPAGGFVMGNPDAKVKLVEFGSMTCPHCQRFDEGAVPVLLQNYVRTGKVSWEFRNYVRDAVDITASLLARCNGARSFFPLTRALYKEQSAWEGKIQNAPQDQLTRIDDLPLSSHFVAIAKLSGLNQLAAARGVAASKTNQCLSNEQAVKQLVQMTADAKAQFPDFPGTPTFVINGKMVELGRITEAQVWPTLEAQIREALGARG